MRITGGVLRGRLISAPKGLHTRPSTDMLRKAVFDMFQSQIEESTFLDLFAGSGALGIEALSRGAKSATFVDHNLMAIKCIRSNLSSLGLKNHAKVIFTDAKKWLKRNTESFDFAYVDPPYANVVIYVQILQLLDTEKTAKTIIVESDLEELPLPTLTNFQYDKGRRYGNSFVHIFLPIS